jgi:hypothetical protein
MQAQQVVIEMPEHCGGDLGGTMRLGRRTSAFLTQASVLRRVYSVPSGCIEERHRHRYEVNPSHVVELCSRGLRAVAIGADEGATRPARERCGSRATTDEHGEGSRACTWQARTFCSHHNHTAVTQSATAHAATH